MTKENIIDKLSESFDCIDILCSCGAVARVKFSQTEQKYLCFSPDWSFDKNRFWNCGQEGHKQVSICHVRTNAAMTKPDSNRWTSNVVKSVDDIGIFKE